MKALLLSLVDCFFPPHCYCCRKPLDDEGDRILCSRCMARLRSTVITHPLCQVCGRPFSKNTADSAPKTCLKCRIQAPRFDRARAIFPYHGPAGDIVKSFKYSDQYHLGKKMVKKSFDLSWFPSDFRDCEAITAVPLHRRKKHQRGYNQSELIAKAIARILKKDFLPKTLKRKRYTIPQASLAARQRIENVKGAFEMNTETVPQTIMLVDDVLTTGATANECAKVLKQAGCRSVYVFTLARAAL